ncbi:hypothetical protein [Kitasatospora acidiphila]|uniref:hypothetical protein n=1 Tax=Kitasatospora acidiphila TaxID=2567942 RepID=UPI003C73392C
MSSAGGALCAIRGMFMPIHRLLRATVPLGLATALLTACGPGDTHADAPSPSASKPTPGSSPSGPKGTFADPLTWKAKATTTVHQEPSKDGSQLSISPVSVVKGDPAAVARLGLPVMTSEMAYYVTTTYTALNHSVNMDDYARKLFLDSDPQHTYDHLATWGTAFAPCQEASYAALSLKPGASVATCQVYLLPRDAKPAFLSFTGDQAATTPEVVWKID